jgi:hypothetical protein
MVVFPVRRQAAFDPRMLDRRFMDDVVTYLTQDAVFAVDQK